MAFSFSWCLEVREGLLPLPTSHEERRSLFVSLLIKSEGSGKPLQLISTKKFAPKRKLSATYSRCKTYQILRIENKSVKLKGYVMLDGLFCLLLLILIYWVRVGYSIICFAHSGSCYTYLFY